MSTYEPHLLEQMREMHKHIIIFLVVHLTHLRLKKMLSINIAQLIDTAIHKLLNLKYSLLILLCYVWVNFFVKWKTTHFAQIVHEILNLVQAIRAYPCCVALILLAQIFNHLMPSACLKVKVNIWELLLVLTQEPSEVKVE